MSGARRYDLARERMEELLRAEQPPEARWDVVERTLLARLARPALRRQAAPAPSPFRGAALLAAAAAALVLGVVAAARSGPDVAAAPVRVRELATVPLAAGAQGELDYRALRVGDAIEAVDTEVSLVDARSVRWTLMPRSRAVVRDVGVNGVGHVVALERGVIRAEVVPRDAAEGLVEVFAIEVNGTRVAVHGTLFTVTHAGDHLEVDVEHGAVAIGPAAYRGPTTAHLLVGPSRGSFSLDGGRTSRLLPRPERGPVAAAELPVQPLPGGAPAAGLEEQSLAAPRSPATVAAPPPAASLAAASAPLAGVRASAPKTLTPAAIQASLARCFDANRRDGLPLVHRSITSTLHVSVRPDGSVGAVRFEPPLRPALQACAESIYEGTLAGGQQEIAIPLTIEE
jgi:ferric-dicitrate binding protein FerR (iron transport regulator)